MGTSFTKVYRKFLNKITDDMYLELTPEDTYKDLRRLLISAIPLFEFPRQVLSYQEPSISSSWEDMNSEEEVSNRPKWVSFEDTEQSDADKEPVFDNDLTEEEQNILALLMMGGWLQRQVTSIENTRMKYSSADFKLTSQANHLQKLLTLLTECQRQAHHFQRLYKRRYTDDEGLIHSNWRVFGRDHHGIRY